MELDELLRRINEAFGDVPRPDLSLRHFWLTDQKGMKGTITEDEWRLAGATRTDKDWRDISQLEIEHYGCQLAHMQGACFAYFLPAYMCYAAQHTGEEFVGNEVLGSVLFGLRPFKDHPEYSRTQYGNLTLPQRESIASFLQYIARQGNDYERRGALDAVPHWP